MINDTQNQHVQSNINKVGKYLCMGIQHLYSHSPFGTYASNAHSTQHILGG